MLRFGCGWQQKCHVAASPPARVRSKMERKQAKTGGVGYGQFNRTANKGNKNNNDTDKGKKHNTNHTTQRAALHDRHRKLLSHARVPAPQLPPTATQRDGTWYGRPCSVWPGWGWVSPPGCAPSWILVKINPVLAKPRTMAYSRYPVREM